MRVQGSAGYIYFITSGDGYCKIGKATNPEGRLRALQSGSAQRLHLAHRIKTDNYGKCELFFHLILCHYRTRGEWFELPGYLLNQIRGITSLDLSEMTEYREQTICAWLPRDKNPRTVSEQKKRQEAEERQRREAQARAGDPHDDKKARAEKKAREDEQIRRLMEALAQNQRPSG